MSSIKTDLIDSLIQEFRPQNVRVNDTFYLGLFNLTYDVYNITMESFSMDYNNSVIEFQEEKPNIRVIFRDLQMNLQLRFNITADPRFYVDEGPGQIVFGFNNITIGLGIIQTDGIFQFEVQDIEASFKGGDSRFDGQGDLSFAFTQLATLLRQQMFNNPSLTIQTMVQNVLPFINSRIFASGCKATTNGLNFNWCAMSNPKFDNSSVALVFKGEVTSERTPTIPFEEMRVVNYTTQPSGNHVSLFVSDYFLNTTLYSAYHMDLIQYEITNFTEGQNLTAGTFSLLFPNITEHIPRDTPVVIRAKASKDYIPNLRMPGGETIVTMLMDISFATVDSQQHREDFIMVTSNVTVELDVEITSPFRLNTDVRMLRVRASELNLDKFNLTTVEDFNAIIGSISGFIRNYINRSFSGYRFGEIDLGFIRMDVNQTKLIEQERYFYGAMSPRFTHNITHQVFGNVESFKSGPASYQEQVEAVANLLKLTPIYQGLQELKEKQHLYAGLGNMGTFGVGRFNLEEELENSSMPLERDEDDYVYTSMPVE